MQIRAFRPLRPPSPLAARVASPPYDVVSTVEARALAAGNPHCFLRISRPEIEWADGKEPAADAAYARGAENLAAFRQAGWLVPAPRPAIYFYRLAQGNHAQTGLVALSAVADYEQGRIKRHELTRTRTEEDRLQHILALNTQTGPVLLTYRDEAAVAALTAAACAGPPEVEFTAPNGVTHSLWSAPEPDQLEAAFARIPATYIADGHHRAAAAARAARALGGPDRAPDGAQPADWFLTALFPASEMRILAYNRVVRDLHGMTPAQFLARLDAVFERWSPGSAVPARANECAVYLAGQWHTLGWTPPPPDDPVAALDVSVIQQRLFHEILDIANPRENPRLDFVGGSHGVAELQKRVDQGAAAAAFSLYPTGVGQLLAVADAGRVMPPKSTWFEPKLCSGLLVHAFAL